MTDLLAWLAVPLPGLALAAAWLWARGTYRVVTRTELHEMESHR